MRICNIQQFLHFRWWEEALKWWGRLEREMTSPSSKCVRGRNWNSGQRWDRGQSRGTSLPPQLVSYTRGKWRWNMNVFKVQTQGTSQPGNERRNRRLLFGFTRTGMGIQVKLILPTESRWQSDLKLLPTWRQNLIQSATIKFRWRKATVDNWSSGPTTSQKLLMNSTK